MSRFKTLLQREWMQHHRGWLAVMFAPGLLVLVGLMFVDKSHITPHGPAPMMMGITFMVTALTFLFTCMVVALQAPGTARRDQQDRSIEFWVSLPTGHSQSVAATLLMHFLLVPLLGLGIGYLASQLVGIIVVTAASGLSGLIAVPWGAFMLGGLTSMLSAAFGVLLASLWLLPIILLTMVASAWLKRWGVPVLVAGLGVGQLMLSKVYGIGWIADTLGALWHNAWRAFGHHSDSMDAQMQHAFMDGVWPVTPEWLAQGALDSIRDLAQPVFVVGLLLSAACFALLVLRRRRG